eukprot:TCONS_00040644-protein
MSCKFEVGERFSSFEELERKLKIYKEENATELYKVNTRSLENAVKRKSITTDKNINSDLRYYELNYRCVEGGKCSSRSTGKRKTKTFKKECPFIIKFGADEDAQTLVVKSIKDEHNHQLDKNLFRHYTSQRKVPKDVKKKAADRLKAKANKKIVRLQMSRESGKVVTMRDVHNLAYQTKKEHQNSRNDLEEVIKILKEEFGKWT